MFQICRIVWYFNGSLFQTFIKFIVNLINFILVTKVYYIAKLNFPIQIKVLTYLMKVFINLIMEIKTFDLIFVNLMVVLFALIEEINIVNLIITIIENFVKHLR